MTMASAPHGEDERHAVIDIGSNTVRMVIYGSPPRAPTVLWNEKVSARLGRDLARTGAIPEAAMAEALAALARFRILARELGITRLETVATAAAREAANGAEFVRRVEKLGLPVAVLSGEEEARASAWGAIGAFPGAEGVVADLGGGSLELVALDHGRCGDGASFPLGTLRLPALRAGSGFDRRIAQILAAPAWARGRDTLYMIGGTWRALASYAMASSDHPLSDPHGYCLSASEAEALAKAVVDKTPDQLAKVPGISGMRAATMPDAAALLRVLLSELSPRQLVFSSWGLREGLYFRSLPEHERGRDPLLASVVDFAHARVGGGEEAAAIARWTANVAGEGTQRLRMALSHLALALHRVEPNRRPAQALEWALDKRWIGIDFAERALLAAALRGSLGLTDAHPRLERLAAAADLRAATGWGLAFRLARRVSGGAAGPLEASLLSLKDGRLELQIGPDHAALATTTVEKALGNLARWLDAEPRLIQP